MREKNFSIQILRAIAVIGVLFFHMIVTEKKYSVDSTILTDSLKIGESGVDLFFVISGFIMAIITYKNWGRCDSVKFLLKRISRIFPVYWFYSLITLSIFIIMPSWVNNSQNNQFNLITSLLLFPSKNLPLVLVAWSLIFEFYFYIVFSVFISFKKQYVITILSFWLVSLIVFNSIFEIESSRYLLRFFTSPYSIEFILGVFTYILFHEIKIKIPSSFYILAIIMSLATIIMLYFEIHELALIKSLILGCLFSIIIFSMVSLEKNEKIKFPKTLIAIGDCSYSIYLSHILIFSGLGKIWISFLNLENSNLDNYIFITISISTAIIFIHFSGKIIERKSYSFLSKKIEDLYASNFFITKLLPERVLLKQKKYRG